MKYPKVESSDARLLVRSLGLLLNQAAVYGPVHNVTKSAIGRVYQEFHENLQRYGVLEFTVKNNLICLNGRSEDLDSSLSSNLVRRFAQLDINGLMFRNPLSLRDFDRGIKVLSMSVAMITDAGGVEALLRAEGIRSIAVVHVDYRRVDAGEDLPLNPESSGGGSGQLDSGVFDLSDDLLELVPELSTFETDQGDTQRHSEEQRRRRQSAQLAALLRQTAASLESNSENPKVELGRVVGALESVRSSLLDMSHNSQRAISSFAQEVNADKLTVAGLEADAIRRGLDLKLTRENIIERYAELQQEIMQPLTVSTGVIEMLSKRQAGDISESQAELLNMACESIDRVTELVDYMRSISGLPATLKPDREILDLY